LIIICKIFKYLPSLLTAGKRIHFKNIISSNERRMNLKTTFTKEEQKNPSYELNSVREYKIGHTTYIVKTYFDLECGESLEDLLQRLVTKEICKAMSS